MKEYNIYQCDDFTAAFQIVSFITREEAEIELKKIEQESIKYDMFTCFYIKEEMKLDYSYCLNQDICIHRIGCKRWIGNYTDEEAIFVSENVFEYLDDKTCMENLFDLLDRFRLSSSENLK